MKDFSNQIKEKEFINYSNIYFNYYNKEKNYSSFLICNNINKDMSNNFNLDNKIYINNNNCYSNNYNNINPKNINIFNENNIKFNQSLNNSYVNNYNNNYLFYFSPNALNSKINYKQSINNNLNENIIQNLNIDNQIKNSYIKFFNLDKNSNINHGLNYGQNNKLNHCSINYYNSINQANFINNYYCNIDNYNVNEKNQNIFQNISFDSSKINNFSVDQSFLEDFNQFITSLPMNLEDFLCTPKGTLEIKKKLENSKEEFKILLVNLLNKKGLYRIMTNTYGNYVFQQIIRKNEKSFISLIISYISEKFIDISKDSSGTFSLQALLGEISSFEEEQKILNCIKNFELEMAFDKNATHVLQKIVLLFPENHRIFLNDIILNNLVNLSLDSNGICLVKIFIKTNKLISNKKRINDIIINNFLKIAQNPFGNYGIQFLFDIWDIYDLKEIIEKILENIYELSLQQFSSNVIEKAIEFVDEENRIKIIRKLCFSTNFILLLIKNKFGKFVLNKAIKYMKLDMKNELKIYLNNDMNKNLYKKKDKNKIKKLLFKL